MSLPSHDTLQGLKWHGTSEVEPATYICAYCGDKVAAAVGYYALIGPSSRVGFIRICPNCHGPAFFFGPFQVPSSMPGNTVNAVPAEISQLYQEARLSAGAGAYTAAVLICRKLLMHIAVAEGAAPGRSFVEYVEYLDSKSFVPPKGKRWVDYIRKRGNEANHEIRLMGEQDAVSLISFIEMLLRFIYEFPGMIPADTP